MTRARLGWTVALSLLASTTGAFCQTYAERLGWPPGARVVILHVDDAGMSHDSNVGAIRAVTEGAATSMSIMMPTPWVPELLAFLRQHPEIDAGLHLTLTSEWDRYRWGPLVGKPAAPGLVDAEGCLPKTVAEVAAHATPEEVEAEIRAQIARARAMGLQPTHLDSHMGTIFSREDFVERYIKVGLEMGIPVMLPAGHNSFLTWQFQEQAIAQLRAEGKWQEGQPRPPVPQMDLARERGAKVWEAGLPVLDDLHNLSYDWRLPAGSPRTDEAIRELAVEHYSQALRDLRPGVTMMIMHATEPTEVFEFISDSGDVRKGDLLAMLDPRLRRVITEEKIIQTTWRELMERRRRLKP